MYKLLNTIALLLLSGLIGACTEDKEPVDVPDIDRADAQSDVGDEQAANETGEGCVEHTDCPFSDLCIDSECVDRDQVLGDCEDDLDCPEDFICVEEECEEE